MPSTMKKLLNRHYNQGKESENPYWQKNIKNGWSVYYEENMQTGEYDIPEKYCGDRDIKKTKEQKYLGFVL